MARFAGKLHTWHQDRGFGFIRPSDGGQDIFVHVSALPTPRPEPDEVLTFEVGLNQDGKKKAVDVRRQHVEATGLAADVEQMRSRRRRAAGHEGEGKLLQCVIGLIVVAALVWYGYSHYQRRNLVYREPVAAPAGEPAIAPVALHPRCDGRTMCSQMKSCEEATFFLRNCPGTRMDGNNDGVPCEQQWCTSVLSR